MTHHTQIHITLPEVQELHSDSPFTDLHHSAGSSRTTQWFTIHRSASPCRKFKNYTVIHRSQICITLPEVQEPHSDSPYTDPHHPARSSRTTQWFTVHRSASPCRKFKNYTVIHRSQIYITLPEAQHQHSDSPYTDPDHPAGISRTTQWFTIHRSTSPCQKFKNNIVILHTQIYITLQEAQELHSDSPYTDPHHPAGSSRTTQWFSIHRSRSPCRKFKNCTVIHHTQIHITLPEVQELYSDSTYACLHHLAGNSRNNGYLLETFQNKTEFWVLPAGCTWTRLTTPTNNSDTLCRIRLTIEVWITQSHYEPQAPDTHVQNTVLLNDTDG